MAWPEENGLPYLFKQRMTPKTKHLVHHLDLTQGWIDAGQGWEGKESTLQLTTWSRALRVIILRRPDLGPRYLRAKDVEKAKQPKQEVIDTCLPFLVDADFEYQVLVTSLTADIPAVAQCYRDRADVENVFDEIKNQWGWGGFTSRTFEVTKAFACMTALIYNWWSIFCRLADPGHHREAVTTRPTLLHSVVRQTDSGGQRTLTITSTNGDKGALSRYFVKLGTWLTASLLSRSNGTRPNVGRRYSGPSLLVRWGSSRSIAARLTRAVKTWSFWPSCEGMNEGPIAVSRLREDMWWMARRVMGAITLRLP